LDVLLPKGVASSPALITHIASRLFLGFNAPNDLGPQCSITTTFALESKTSEPVHGERRDEEPVVCVSDTNPGFFGDRPPCTFDRPGATKVGAGRPRLNQLYLNQGTANYF